MKSSCVQSGTSGLDTEDTKTRSGALSGGVHGRDEMEVQVFVQRTVADSGVCPTEKHLEDVTLRKTQRGGGHGGGRGGGTVEFFIYKPATD